LSLKRSAKLHNAYTNVNNELIKTNEKYEKLLKQIMPGVTANEYMLKGRAKSKKYDLVTVLFCDIQGFTKIAQELNPEILVDKLDTFFFHFDSVISKYNIEKIKTIGDAYMAAGGIPIEARSNPMEVILAALEMLKYMIDLKETDQSIWDLRIGIHTGPVIAGMVGKRRMSYDIWGDTVNTASRMESSGIENRINISEETYLLVKDYFECEFRGKMPVKYKGNIGMYLVKGIKKGYFDGNPFRPNDKLVYEIQNMKIINIADSVFRIMENTLPQSIKFHNLKHTFRLYQTCELYSRSEELPHADALAVQLASIFYDVHYLKHNYDIILTVRNISDILTDYKFDEQVILKVMKLISVKDFPQNPSSKAEQVFYDSLNDFIGRADFIENIQNYYLELFKLKKSVPKDKWIKKTGKILKDVKFYTESARSLREIEVSKQVDLLKTYL
jgi:class 3 adenylate cyclase